MGKKYKVIVVQYCEENEENVDTSIQNLKEEIEPNCKVQIAYEGADEKVVEALQKILALTK